MIDSVPVSPDLLGCEILKPQERNGMSPCGDVNVETTRPWPIKEIFRERGVKEENLVARTMNVQD